MGEFDEFVSPAPDADATPLPAGTMPPVIRIHAPRGEFDEFATPSPSPSGHRESPKPTNPKSWSEKINNAWDIVKDTLGGAVKNTPRSAFNAGRNIKDAFIHPMDTFGNLIGVIGGAGALGGAALAGGLNDPKKMEEFSTDHPDIKFMMDQANQIGGMYKERYGTPESIRKTFRDDPVGFFFDLSTLFSGGSAAMRLGGDIAGSTNFGGRMINAANKLGDAATFTNPLSPSNGLVRGARKIVPGVDLAAQGVEAVAGKAATLGRNLANAYVVPENFSLNPMKFKGPIGLEKAAQNYLMERSAGPGFFDLPNLRDALRYYNQLGPSRPLTPPAGQTGNIHNVGEAIAPEVNAPRMAALVKASERHRPEQATAIQNRQNAARQNTLNEMGQVLDPETFENINYTSNELRNIREQNASLYDEAGNIPLTLDDQIHSMLSRPSMQRAFNRAELMAAERDEPFLHWPGGNNVPAMGTRPQPPGVSGNAPMLGGGPPEVWPVPHETGPEPVPFPLANDQRPQVLTRDMHNVQMALSDQAYDPAVRNQFGIGAAEVSGIRDTRNALIDWLQNRNDLYRAARNRYRSDSLDLDRKSVAEYLQQRLADPIAGDNSATQRAASFTNALNPASWPTTLRRSTGQSVRYETPEALYDHPDMQRIGAVQDDLARSRLYEQQAQAGSQYSNDLHTAVSDYLGGGVPIGNAISYPRQILHWILSGKDENVANKVSNNVLYPNSPEMDQMLTDAINRRAQMWKYDDRVNMLRETLMNYPAAYDINAEVEKTRNKKKKK